MEEPNALNTSNFLQSDRLFWPRRKKQQLKYPLRKYTRPNDIHATSGSPSNRDAFVILFPESFGRNVGR